MTVAVLVAARAGAVTVSDIASLFREEAAAEPGCEVSGVVSCTFAWRTNSFVMVDASDPNGPAIYVSGDVPGYPAAVFRASSSLTAGDMVLVRGRIIPFMLEPGVVATEIVVKGRCEEMPQPPLKRLVDLASGAYNNRRVCVRGILMHTRVGASESGEKVTTMLLRTGEGTMNAHLRGEWPDLLGFRDAELEIDGVCVPSYNARAEFLRPEIEALSRGSIRIVPPSSSTTRDVPKCPGRSSGVMAWTPDGYDGHLRRLQGEVTYVSAKSRFFVVAAEAAVRVDIEEGDLPDVGSVVEVEGFPMMSDDCGILEAGVFKVVSKGEGRSEPDTLSEKWLAEMLSMGDPGEYDCHYRLVRMAGRVVYAGTRKDGTTVVELDVGGHRVSAVAEGEFPEVESLLRDSPRVMLTGVIKVLFEDNDAAGRGITLRGVRLLMRGPNDIELLPDAAWRSRRIMRIAVATGLYSLIPLAALVLWLVIRASRQRVRTAAVAEDRRRMAEELHDTIAQYLSGARLLLFSVQAESSHLTDAARGAVSMAGDILETARRELRDKILNLQSDELMTMPPKRMLQRIAAKAGAAGGVKVKTMLRGLPQEMSSAKKTDLVAIVQECITNAVKHGGASRVLIVSDPTRDGGWTLSVLNDGDRFDGHTALGPETGHFGLSSMRERAARNGFSVEFGERRGWTEVKLERRTR